MFPEISTLTKPCTSKQLTMLTLFLRSPNQRTPARPAIAFIKSFGLKVANDNPALIERFGMDKVFNFKASP